jgi:hypothetical protein
VIRVLVLSIVAAFVANAGCYGTCATGDCHSGELPSSHSCPHHQKSPPPSRSICEQQHPSFTGPANGNGLAELHAAAASAHPVPVFMPRAYFSARELATAVRIQVTRPPLAQPSPSPTGLRI